MQTILEKARRNEPLTQQDAVRLLNIDCTSADFYRLLSAANEKSRLVFQNKGYIFAQIGMNAAPCSGNCKFCSLARDHYVVESTFEKSLVEVVAQVQSLALDKLNSVFLMTTADYSFEAFLQIGQAVKTILPPQVHLVANIGDFGPEQAARLVETGFYGVYHIVRLREGQDTDLPPAQRVATLDAAKAAGLSIYYCVEPIGPEHTAEELADEMLRARSYGVDVMAVMGRTGVKGTPFADSGELSELELTKIAAVARLVTDPKISMNVHEPKSMPLLAGVNQFYAEIGVNPRDTSRETAANRGKSVADVEKMLLDAHYHL